MAEGRKLTIYRRFFTDSDCYKSGVQSGCIGVQVHSTGANNPYLRRYVQPDDGRLGANKNGNSHNRPGVDVCANAYIGRTADGTVAVYQTLPWDTRCWISGKGRNGNANRLGYIGFEICEDDLASEYYFEAAVMTAAVNLTAHLCKLMGTTPGAVVDSFPEGEALAVMDHSELARLGIASGHADISHWLRRYGKQMRDFRAEVEAAMAEGVMVNYVDAAQNADAEEWMSVNEPRVVWSQNGGYVNLREQPSTASRELARLDPGTLVQVTAMTGVWSRVEWEDRTGYMMTEFLRRIESAGGGAVTVTGKAVIIDSAGNVFRPVGGFRVDFEMT